ncbi:uncharacterized protein PAC_16714 [Phialocephala subalpina]|uniref:DUF1941 family protein n=1 Tax=Phialocephala subalpina TaxID=576137 RepID=A0A1L7XP56_9HELO|nr:uncharacterized protein PAC_16714 [Phialocephala subalpina]
MADEGASGPAATLQKMQDLLRAKDDTSRFVGLALLKSVLENGHLAQDSKELRDLWEALSPKFLDRLLRARQNEKLSQTDSKDMVDLAVAVLHTFTILLPEDCRRDKRLTGRTAPLVKALVLSPPETTLLILQTLLSVVSQPEGAVELLHLEDLSPLTELANQYPLVLEIISFTWTNAALMPSEVPVVQKRIDQIFPTLIVNFRGSDGVTLLSSVANLIPKLEPGILPNSPKWLGSLIEILRKLVANKPTAAGRAAYTQLAAALLQTYPATCPAILFKDERQDDSDSKPFSYLFINLLLIDLRSSFPSLLSQLNSSQYPATAQRLAAAFDVISSFVAFLIGSLDEEVNTSGFSMASDLLLKLRKDIAETISLTIEYLRDRWDASIAGAAGLHHDARSGTAATSEGTRLTLTWESIKDQVHTDPLVLAGIRAMAIWIREDENDNLRNEATGMMDMLVELYKLGSQGSLDFRYPILLALEGTMLTDGGVDAFLNQNGWDAVSEDLQTIVRSTAEQKGPEDTSALDDANRGLQIVRVLLAVVDHQSTSFPQEAWMTAVTTTASMNVPASTPAATILEFQIAMLQLSTALLSKASGGMMKRYITSYPALSGLVKQLSRLTKGLPDEAEAADLLSLLEDVSLDLGNLR